MPQLPWSGRYPEFQHAQKSLATFTPQTLVNGTTIFRVNGGPIIIRQLISYCIAACDATAATLQWSADGDVGAATTISAASASLASMIAGNIIYNNFTTIATAPVITGTTGVALAGPTAATGGGIYCPAGIITTVIASGPTTGTFLHFIRYEPMTPQASVLLA